MSDDPIRPRIPFRAAEARSFLWRLLSRAAKTKVFWIAVGALFVVWCGPSSCATYVPPNTIGLKQVYYGTKAGIKPESYGPGTHFLVAGVERMHLFPRDLQLINFSDSSSEVSQKQRQAPSIKIQTSDGYNVQLDVSLLFHIQDPYKVFVESGPGRAYEDRLLLPRR